MNESLGDLRRNRTELVLWRSYNVHKKGIVAVIVGEFDDECGNVVVLEYAENSKEGFEIPESLLWRYLEIREQGSGK